MPQGRDGGAGFGLLLAQGLFGLGVIQRFCGVFLLDRAFGAAAAGIEQEFAIIIHITVKAFDAALAHQPELIGAGLDKVAVMRDEDHRALIFVERPDQRLAAVHIEMVGGLIEDKHMRRAETGEGKKQPRLFAAREVIGLGIGLVNTKAKPAQLGADLRFGGLGHQGADMIIRGFGIGQLIHLVLGEITDAGFFVDFLAPAHGGKLAGQELGKSALAVAVCA